MRDRGVIHSRRAHAHTHTHIHLPHRPFIFTLTGISCSVSLAEEKEGEGERGRETEEGCQGRSEKGGWRGRRKKTASDSSFLFHAKPSTDLPHLLLSGERVKRAQLLCTVILVSSSSTLPLFNCILRILLILLLLGHINTHPLPPHSSCVHPSLPPGAYLSGLVPVCLFADDSTWSRCDAQQLFLCSAVPSLPHTPPLLPLISPHSHLCLPLQCLLCSYLSMCLFVPTLLKRKLASLILLSDVFFCFFLPSSSLTSLSNLLHFPAFLDAAVNVQST